MSIQKYSVNQHLIETLLGWVKSAEIAIPEIQRPFVWEANQVRDLLDSLYKGYPIGYIIIWKNPDVKAKDGSLTAGKKILIDGQQRITAMSAALLGQSVVNGEYKQVKIRIAFNPVTQGFEVLNPAIEKDKEWITDIVPLMQGEVSMLKLIRQYRIDNPKVPEDELELVISRLMGIVKKQIGIIELAADLDIETVTEIFIRINREGVSLSQADFVMSKIAANEEYGGNLLRKAIDYFCHLSVAPEFYSNIENNDSAFSKTDYFKAMRWLKDETDDLYDPSYNDMLRVTFTARFARGKLADLVALLSGRNFESRTFEERIAEESFGELRLGVLDFMSETNYRRFLMIIRSAGFINGSLAQSRGALNFAYVLYLRLRAASYKPDQIEKYVRRWFVLSLLTARYSGSAETTFDRDIRGFEDRGAADYVAETEAAELSDAYWKAGLIQDMVTSNSNHPAFKTFLAAQVKSGARGFLSSDITVAAMLQHRGDVHHVFPKNHLVKKGLSRSRYNQIANFAFTQQEINISIGDLSPSEYVEALNRQIDTQLPRFGGIVTRAEMERNFQENAIPSGFLEGGVLTKDYDAFLAERRKSLAEYLRAYYAGL